MKNVPEMVGVFPGMVVVQHDHLRGLVAESLRHFVDVESAVLQGVRGPGMAVGVGSHLFSDDLFLSCHLEPDKRGRGCPRTTDAVAEDRAGRVHGRETIHEFVQFVTDPNHPVLASDPACLVFRGVQPPQPVLQVPRLDFGDLPWSCACEPHRLEKVTVAVVIPELDQRLVFLPAHDHRPAFDLWRLHGQKWVVADVDALLPHGPGKHRLAAVDVRPLRLVRVERLGPSPKMNSFEFGVDEQLAYRLPLVIEVTEMTESLLVPLRQVGICLRQFRRR